MEWLTGTSSALAKAREGGTRNWKYPLIGAIMLIPLVAYAIPLASFAALAGIPGTLNKSGMVVAFSTQWLIGLTLLALLFIACGVIAYRLFGWPTWAAIAFGLAAPVAIDVIWIVGFNLMQT
ncbi:MAG: hypothetical protein LBK95_14265 [Bifidobacteriaceae bacterium]|jgi:hypothetical protein|nr:hypothetical protein [Bifidobacteriaceae bacterium]